uniref:Uncharacterized protein n=1 Tax=Solanum lycopersicum TaxID=4081 RepID=K4AU19_SOLLC
MKCLCIGASIKLMSIPIHLINDKPATLSARAEFHDPSMLVEALTQGSYMLPEISR